MTICKLTHQAVLEQYQFILLEVSKVHSEWSLYLKGAICQGLQEEMKLYWRF